MELDFRELLKGAGINERFLERYLKVVSTEDRGIVEHHHILPESLFPQYSEDPRNIVGLCPKRHVVAHHILYHMFHKHGPMQTAYWFMIHTRGTRVTSRAYHELRTKVIESARSKMSECMRGKHTYEDENGNRYHLNTNDPFIAEANLTSIFKGKGVYKDNNGNCFQMETTSHLIHELGLVHISTGRTMSEERRTEMRKHVLVKDDQGCVSRIQRDDERYLSGELKHINVGTVNVVVDGINRKISTEEFSTGHFQSINKGKVDVIDEYGNVFKVEKTDERLVNGSLRFNITENKRESSRRNMLNYNKSCVGKVWLTSPEGKSKMFESDLVDSLLEQGYSVGRSTKNRICITDGKVEKHISPDQQIPPGFSVGTRKRCWVSHPSGKSKRILVDDLLSYIEDGWTRGRIM